jgi:hypothetical protein
MLTSGTNIDVDISDDILDRLNDLLEDYSFSKFGFEHCVDD